ncbi:ABC transporter substrate-binding protein [Paenibacillus senegalensis]|uniref:ABC transporter substrate-binding protein n=1 Tax=Paenibacillus senegalensis TaxID=1465766 RepID=UPI00028807E3|nr:ABC transporter substrate-binding protein [Paenibacillus senegalensis]
MSYKFRSVRFLFGLSLLSIGLLAACGSGPTDTNSKQSDGAIVSKAPEPSESAPVNKEEAEPEADRVFTDELGHEVVVPEAPVRIFAPYMEDALLTLGVEPVAQWSNGNQGHRYLEDKLQGIPKMDFSGGMPSSEELLSYEPDLIILHTANYAENGVYENYSKIAPTYVFSNAAGDVEKSLEKLGELIGKTDEVNQALESYRQKVNEAKAAIEQNASGKKVAIIRFASRGVSLMGGNYFCGYVINQHLGMDMTPLAEDENSLNISLEILPELDADYIFVINAYGQGTERMKEMTESNIWKSIPAVQQGHVYEVNDEYWLGSGLIAYEKIIDDVVKLLAR